MENPSTRSRPSSPLAFQWFIRVHLRLSAFLLFSVPTVAFAGPKDGMVVAASPYAAQIGAETLERGGNAVDAAVATAFALTVAEPGMNGLGGRTVMIVGRPGGRVEGLNGATAWPKAWIALRKARTRVKPPTGWGQVAVPGTLAALVEANRKWGRLPLRDLIRPSIHLARTGFIVSRTQENLFRDSVPKLKDPLLRKTFLHPNGRPYRAGERLRQPELARALERITVEGPDAFYRGAMALAMTNAMWKHGGYVRHSDLRAYRPRPAVIDEIPDGSYRIAAVDKPAMGRALLWRMRVLQQLAMHTDTERSQRTLAELLNVEPPPGPKGETDAAERRLLLQGDSVKATADRLNWILRNGATGFKAAPPAPPVTHTTHLVTADRMGNIVSLTQSLGPFFGAKVALPGYGITFAATMGYLEDTDVSQGPVSSIAPTLVFDASGRPILGIGAAGSDRIPGVILQVLRLALDRRRTIQQAVAAPRLVVDKEDGRSTLRMEGIYTTPIGNLNPVEREGVNTGESLGWNTAAIRKTADALQTFGIPLRPLEEGQVLGRVHALMWTPGVGWVGAPDPRWFGAAVAPLSVPVRAVRSRSASSTR